MYAKKVRFIENLLISRFRWRKEDRFQVRQMTKREGKVSVWCLKTIRDLLTMRTEEDLLPSVMNNKTLFTAPDIYNIFKS